MACAGERRLDELELAWLRGYEDSQPVRIGNAASKQFQLDVYGELMDSMYQRAAGRHRDRTKTDLALQAALVEFLESNWEEPDEGIWEVRGGRQQFYPFQDDGLGGLRSGGQAGRRLRLRGREISSAGARLRDEIHAQVCRARLQRKEEGLHPVLWFG